MRSVTSTILNLRNAGWLRIARIRNTIVRLLPDPLGMPDDPATAIHVAVVGPSRSVG